MAESAPSVARATPAARGPHRVAPVMGTVISIDVRDPAIPESAVDAMLARLEEIEGRFSPYRPDSEISRIARGELAEGDASAEVRFVLGMCDDLHRTTGGWFDARGHRADGRLDPRGGRCPQLQLQLRRGRDRPRRAGARPALARRDPPPRSRRCRRTGP